MKAAGKLRDRGAWVAMPRAQALTMLRKTNFDAVPMKPQRVYQCMNNAFGRRHLREPIGLSQIAAAQFLHVQGAPLDQLRPGRPARLDHPAALGVVAGRPERKVVACRATTTSSS